MAIHKEEHKSVIIGYFYACCPYCRNILTQGKSGLCFSALQVKGFAPESMNECNSGNTNVRSKFITGPVRKVITTRSRGAPPGRARAAECFSISARTNSTFCSGTPFLQRFVVAQAFFVFVWRV